MSNTEEDMAMESSNSQSGPSTPMPPSGPGTPMASNPGTPRSSAVDSEFRNTPPPTSSAVGNVQQQQMRNTPPPTSQSAYSSAASAPASITNQSAQRPVPQPTQPQSKYTQLLAVIEDMGRDIRPTYSGSRTSVERLKRGIVHARILVRECLMECERAART